MDNMRGLKEVSDLWTNSDRNMLLKKISMKLSLSANQKGCRGIPSS